MILSLQMPHGYGAITTSARSVRGDQARSACTSSPFPGRDWRTIRSVERMEEIDEKRGIALKYGTEDVPNDGRYHVLVDGEIVLSTRVQAAAQVEFQDRREQRMAAGRNRLAAESAHRDARQFKNDILKTKANKKIKQGARPKH